MTRLFTAHPQLVRLDGGSLSAPRVHVINADAFVWLDSNTESYDFVIVDFPDPNNYGVGKLDTTAFYRLLSRHLSRGGLAVVQSTSPMFARQSYWAIDATLRAAGLRTWPYHAYVPSFGEWGFILAAPAGGADYQPPTSLPDGLRYLTANEVAQLFQFPRDMRPVAAEVNRLDNQVLVRYYEREFDEINR